MALSSKSLTNILFLAVFFFLSSSLHHSIHARESEFFSKFTNPHKKEEPNSYNQDQDQDQYQYQDQAQAQVQQDNPTFIPPSTTATTTSNNIPYKNDESDQFENPNTHNSNHLYNKEAYMTTQPQGSMRDTRFMHKSYNNINGGNSYTSNNPNGYNNYYYYHNGGNNPYNTQLMNRGYNTNPNGNNYYNGKYRQQHPIQQQGMSDTRFLENGKYYYDLESENKYNQAYQNSRGLHYSDKGYSGNSYEYNTNSMDGLQSQDKYQDDRDEFMT